MGALRGRNDETQLEVAKKILPGKGSPPRSRAYEMGKGDGVCD